jgi:hypothetical protein
MATTTNYGWTTPDDTALVKDGAAAIRSLGTAIDTSFAADEGDLLVGGTSDIFEALPIGAAGTVLTSDGDTAEWAAPAGGGANWSLLNSGGTALTAAQTITVSGISAKDKIMVVIGETVSSASASSEISLRLNTDSGSNYSNFGTNIYYPSGYSATMQDRTGDLTGTKIPLFQLGGSASGYGAGYCLISGANAAGVKVYNSVGGVNNTGNNATQYLLGGIYNSATVISSISVISSSGNFDSGSVYVYTSA